jgi:hypothetical protein
MSFRRFLPEFKPFACFVIMLCVTCSVYSSEEDFLGWQSVVIRSKEAGAAGIVVIEIETEGRDFTSLVVNAFGKQFALASDELAKMAGFQVSSLRTTHEAGYEEVGGHTVYLSFQRTSLSKIDGPVTEEIKISVNSSGISVADPIRPERQHKE